jgi:hypothetical protein
MRRAILLGVSLLAAAASRDLSARQAQSTPLSFTRTIFPIFEAAQCRGCHAEDGVASATRLHFPEPNASPDEVDAFGLTLAVLVDRANPERSLLLNKPTNRVRHTGGVRIQPGSFEETALTEWVRQLAGVPEERIAAARERLAAAAAATPSGDQTLRRLTHSQYNNTVRDLLGDFSRPADRFPPEDFVNGFRNQRSAQSIPPLLAEAYSAAAEKLALNAFRAGDVNGLVPCKPSSPRDAACRDQFLRTFGLHAFRRPLTDAEVKRYADLFNAQTAAPGKGSAPQFLDGARAVVEAMLQSPKLLFLTEARTNAGRAAPDYEIASRLSYLLWNTMPDRALFEAAAAGQLHTPDAIERAARTMLNHRFAREAVDEFFSEWLRFDRALGSVKDRRRFPEFTPELAAMMVQETRLLLDHLVWDSGSFMEAFTADYSFLNSDLASVYGVPAPAGEFERVPLTAAAHRAGLLGHASFLSSNAGPVETSPTARGIFVREQLLCQHVPNPPPGVNTQVPEPTPDSPRARRQRMQSHVENPTCASCHRLMDPIGFGLENYDALGQWRDQELIEFEGTGSGRNKTPPKTFQLPIDRTGEIAGLPNAAFTDPIEIGRLLATSPACQECIVKQVFRYAFGRPETAADRETIRRAFSTFRDSGFKFKELLIALVRAPQFLEGVRGPGQPAAQ